jgi:hypothetical protein
MESTSFIKQTFKYNILIYKSADVSNGKSEKQRHKEKLDRISRSTHSDFIPVTNRLIRELVDK